MWLRNNNIEIEWKDIYNGNYSISNTGIVMGKLLMDFILKRGLYDEKDNYKTR